MKKFFFLTFVIVSFFFSSCAESFDGKVKETSYWANSGLCLELTPEGSVNLFISSSGNYNLYFSTTYRIEKSAEGDILYFSGSNTFTLGGGMALKSTVTEEYGPGRFDKSRSILKIPIKRTTSADVGDGTTATSVYEDVWELSKTSVVPR